MIEALKFVNISYEGKFNTVQLTSSALFLNLRVNCILKLLTEYLTENETSNES